MKRLWRQIIGGERGQALPIVLSVMIIGGLMIAPALNHISTSLNAGRMVEENVKGVYAAEAGVEEALWCLKNSVTPIPEQLPENVNQMEVEVKVEVETEGKGKGKGKDEEPYTLYNGELKENDSEQYDWLNVGGEMEPTEEEDVYKYTITVTWQAEGPPWPTIVLQDVGARLPIGFEYVEDSADEFDENLSTDEPDITQDWAGAYLLNWTTFDGDKNELIQGGSVTLTFNVTGEITGEGEPEGDYTWVNSAQTEEIGEVIGKLYSITSTATRPEDVEPTATVVADVLVDETDGEVYIVRWQINPE